MRTFPPILFTIYQRTHRMQIAESIDFGKAPQLAYTTANSSRQRASGQIRRQTGDTHTDCYNVSIWRLEARCCNLTAGGQPGRDATVRKGCCCPHLRSRTSDDRRSEVMPAVSKRLHFDKKEKNLHADHLISP